MNKTKIEYLTHTWNPIAMRCTPVSAGCVNCWHLRMADRMAANPKIAPEQRAAYAGKTKPVLIQDRLSKPLKRKKSAIVGVQFMGDIFHDDVPDSYIEQVWRVMVKAHWHKFLVLTKRSERMREWVTNWYRFNPSDAISNIWGLVTVEDQKMADKRILDLLFTRFAVRGVSCEPLLSEVNLHLHGTVPKDVHGTGRQMAVHSFLSWVICGGESGPNARPMHPNWAQSLRNQCQSSGTKFFFKQWGEWIKQDTVPHEWSHVAFMDVHGNKLEPSNGNEFWRVGNRRAGHLLDGQGWREMP